ncbi:MAG: glycosyltransferase family A protein [Candidatus Micrarchaeota archaeon]
MQILKTYGKPRGSALVIIPMLSEYNLLHEHMQLLAGQTSDSFDVLLVLNRLTDSEKALQALEECALPACVIVGRRKEDTGSAGAFSLAKSTPLNKDTKA